ncbi:acyltransferase [Flavobacterium sp. NRK1]|uniref:acyltransferase family protein n=1 Tax=Flavobacterium sp. NRK1 TaxID=2954929 RepID=UPI0020933171|nr:acyltransferase [Flavobacterium sp. NRK1]MCO6146586.1 acyltransferase [Flavobacterium sp. NRK1]
MRLEQLTFTRFIAALGIVIFHFGLNAYPFNTELVLAAFEKANMGVSYFFVLSGFIMVIAYSNFNRIDAVGYYKNRFARLYPLLVLSVLPFFAAIMLTDKVTFTDLILNLSLLQAWIPGHAVVGNYPLWSLSVEVFFYALFPLLYNRILKKYDVTTLILPILLLWAGTVVLHNYLLSNGFYQGFGTQSHDLIYYFPPMHLNQFLIGNLTGMLFLKRKSIKGNYDLLIVLAGLIIFMLLKYSLGIDYHDGFLAVFFAVFIFLMAVNTGVFCKLFSGKPLVFLGEISYGIYVLMVPVYDTIELIFEKLGINFNEVGMFYLKLAVLIAISAFCHIFIEKPLRNKIKMLQLKKHNAAL